MTTWIYALSGSSFTCCRDASDLFGKSRLVELVSSVNRNLSRNASSEAAEPLWEVKRARIFREMPRQKSPIPHGRQK